MKRALLYFSFFIFHFSLAQNLVPNCSFEDTLQCVNDDGAFNNYVKNWRGQCGGGGLVYFTSQCTNSPQFNVPSNEFGFQHAHTGVSYIGIYTYASDTPTHQSDSNFRNYIETKLTSHLMNSIKYYVTFYVSAANTNNFACNDIGAYLSDSLVTLDTATYCYVKENLTPQITNNPISQPLTDTLNWMKITGSYIANGSEQYIIIGNFKNDTISHINYLGRRGNSGAYYYVDDVFVTTDSLLAGESEVKLESEQIKLYPNPANATLNVQLSLNPNEVVSICLYNSIGEVVRCETLKSSLTTIHTADLANGLYYYRITDNTGKVLKADKQVLIH